ncbi:thioredoxin family protein [Kitasatospora sp. NPDC096128]|uniref:thioredoxin family protein n=1 Tax=Kitasatospora sp. NPDC096128 TaxID=3155547 RepID=UPI0033276326
MRQRRALLTSTVLTAVLLTGCSSRGSATDRAAAGPTAAPRTAPAAAAPTVPTPTGSAPASTGTGAGAGTGELPDGYDATRDAAADVKTALAASAGDQRPLLLDFGANWCPDCKVLDKLFRSPQVNPLLRDDYRVVAIDVGRFDHNLDLAAQYVDLQSSGIPALVVLSPDGTVRTASNDGAFADARTMSATTVAAFLKRWARA